MPITSSYSLSQKILLVFLKLAPLLANYRMSMFFWGEVEIPESLQS